MAIAIDKMHGRGSSNEIYPQLLLKKTTTLTVNIAAKDILCTVSALGLKMGVSHRWHSV